MKRNENNNKNPNAIIPWMNFCSVAKIQGLRDVISSRRAMKWFKGEAEIFTLVSCAKHSRKNWELGLFWHRHLLVSGKRKQGKLSSTTRNIRILSTPRANLLPRIHHSISTSFTDFCAKDQIFLFHVLYCFLCGTNLFPLMSKTSFSDLWKRKAR